MSRPARVSVIVATFNSGRHLRPALESALAQTLAEIEIVVVDDGSTDGTRDLLAVIDDPRVRVLLRENRGPAPALAEAMAQARGHYLAFLDHDDVWHPEKLARQAALLDAQPATDLCFSWSGLIDEEGRPLHLHPRRWEGPISFEQLLVDFVIGNTSSVVARRSAVDAAGGLDPELRLYYDVDLVLRVARLRRGNVIGMRDELTFYRRHPAQASSRIVEMHEEWERLLAKLVAGPELAPLLPLARSNMSRYFAFLAFEAGRSASALAWLGRGLRFAPRAFAAERRNFELLSACLLGLVLPRRVLQKLVRAVLAAREGERGAAAGYGRLAAASSSSRPRSTA